MDIKLSPSIFLYKKKTHTAVLNTHLQLHAHVVKQYSIASKME